MAWFRKRLPTPEAAPGPDLLAEIGRLDGRHGREVAVGLAALWDGVLDRFDGVDGFRSADDAEAAAFVADLRTGAERIRGAGRAERSHYAFAPDLMASYLEVLRDGGEGERRAEIALAAVRLIEAGRLAREAPPDGVR